MPNALIIHSNTADAGSPEFNKSAFVLFAVEVSASPTMMYQGAARMLQYIQYQYLDAISGYK